MAKRRTCWLEMQFETKLSALGIGNLSDTGSGMCVFDLLDNDGSGAISSAELMVVMLSMPSTDVVDKVASPPAFSRFQS